MRRTSRSVLYGVYEHGLRPVRSGHRLVVSQWQRGVLFEDGKVVGVLEPGAHRRFGRRFEVRYVDMRPSILHVPTQEVPAADGFTVKVTAAGRVRVVDPVAYVTGSQDPDAALYLAAQIAVREVVAATTVEALMAGRVALADALTAAVRGTDELGLVVERLEAKDVIMPGELKKAQAEVLVARAHGLAALERARGETAALRNLVNAAALLRDNPALLQLRLVQELATTSGHTVVLGAPGLMG